MLIDGNRGVAAHTIIYCGKRYPMSVASIGPDGNIVVLPLTREIPRTVFINGDVSIESVNGAICAMPCNIAPEQLRHI